MSDLFSAVMIAIFFKVTSLRREEIGIVMQSLPNALTNISIGIFFITIKQPRKKNCYWANNHVLEIFLLFFYSLLG